MRLQAFQCACIQFQEQECSSMNLHTVPWAFMHELESSYISLHPVTWIWIQFRGHVSPNVLPCSFLNLYEVPCACMQFHELVHSFFICLSSSQEFCSACLKYNPWVPSVYIYFPIYTPRSIHRSVHYYIIYLILSLGQCDDQTISRDLLTVPFIVSI